MSRQLIQVSIHTRKSRLANNMFYYGVCANALDEYYRIAEATPLISLERLVNAVNEALVQVEHVFKRIQTKVR